MHIPPRVTIGLPVRNGGGVLKDALRSILEQTEQDFEIIVSDNGSEDGSSEFLRALAEKDTRVRYFMQEPAIRAYDNFKFVESLARGRYFMWAAHDDTRDLDFIQKMADALDEDPSAVLAFGDLNIVTPGDAKGMIKSLPFQTTGMGQAKRLAKLSRMQCYYIYGLWRTDAIRRIPYAYCAWWPDLPMMLAAATLGGFKYVPGTRFNYFEIPKDSLERVRNQDFASRFNLFLGVAGLIRATYRACSGVAGPHIGVYCATLVTIKQAINFPGFLYRRLRRLLLAA